jgi:ribonuclease HI
MVCLGCVRARRRANGQGKKIGATGNCDRNRKWSARHPKELAIYTDGSRHAVRVAIPACQVGSVRLKLAHGKEMRLGKPVAGRIGKKFEEREKTGAGFVVYRREKEIAHGKLGLGKKSDNYNGELCALAAAARRAEEESKADLTITAWRIYSDNDAAVKMIGSRAVHVRQISSTSFCNIVDRFLSISQTHTVYVGWLPGPAGVPGNKRADELAKATTSQRSLVGSTLTWLGMRASRQATKTWVQEWELLDWTLSWWGPALSKPPSTKIARFHKGFTGSCELQCRLIQVLLGHSFAGEYYAWFVPSEDTACPCGNPWQGLEHVLWECPVFGHARGALRLAYCRPTWAQLFSTNKGLTSLANFLHRTRAFKKASSARWPPADGDRG